MKEVEERKEVGEEEVEVHVMGEGETKEEHEVKNEREVSGDRERVWKEEVTLVKEMKSCNLHLPHSVKMKERKKTRVGYSFQQWTLECCREI